MRVSARSGRVPMSSQTARAARGVGSAAPGVEAAVVAYLRRARVDAAAAHEHLLGTGAVGELEDRLRRHYGKRHALVVANATSALLAVAIALDLGEGEVVAPPLAWGGSIAGFLHVGARLLFGDVDPLTLTLCPAAAQEALSSRVRALLAVDLFGVPADDEALRSLADEKGLWYIHDAAQSLGATREGRPAGALAHVVVTSFTAGKTLFAGEGGAVLTDDDNLYARLVWLTQHPHRHKRELGLRLANEFALNLRIHPVAAVWANEDFSAALRRLGARQRRANAIRRKVEASGLVQPLSFAERELQPSYFRLTCAWADRPDAGRLEELLGPVRDAPRVRSLAIEPLYAQVPSTLVAGHPCCKNAEEQLQRRFEIAL
ncbi:MAG TPA: DegT/DnrJ/EryC1/StrS family aminotransferase [Longimicrobium sp.]